MAAPHITPQDLHQFKIELLQEIKNIITPANITNRQLLKTWEVKEMLGISLTTLRNMRKKGEIEYTKIGGLLFYNYHHVIQIIEANKKHIPTKYRN